MKIVILCGGLGTRLKEETELKPKPMVSVGGKPILWHVMKNYAHYGYKDFIIALGYKGEKIKEYFQNYEFTNNDVTIQFGESKKWTTYKHSEDIDWRVTMVDTGQQAQKGARLKRLEKYIDGNEFMVTYGDGVGNINIPEILKFHRKHGKIGTLTATVLKSQFGEVIIGKNNKANFTEKPTSKSFINSGYFVFNKEIFKYLTDDDGCDLEYGVLEQLSKENQLRAYKHNGFWRWMDTWRDMEYLNKLWDDGKADWKIW